MMTLGTYLSALLSSVNSYCDKFVVSQVQMRRLESLEDFVLNICLLIC